MDDLCEQLPGTESASACWGDRLNRPTLCISSRSTMVLGAPHTVSNTTYLCGCHGGS
jgi:hypothetical protein